MGHKIKYGAKFFLKIKYFPYLPTHFLGGHVTGNQHIIHFGLTSEVFGFKYLVHCISCNFHIMCKFTLKNSNF